MENIQSDFLVATPGPLFGLARFFDFGATFDRYNHSSSIAEADVKALLSDWYIVAQDLWSSIQKQTSEGEGQ
ncbi:MAG: hypothetical protein ABSC60_17690 [Acidobacteriota bacterium]